MEDQENLSREDQLERDLIDEIARRKRIKASKINRRDEEIREIVEEDASLDKVGALIKRDPVKRGILRSKVGRKLIDFKNIEIFFKEIAKPADIAAVLWYGQAYYASMGKQLKGRGQTNIGLIIAIAVGLGIGVIAIMVIARKYM